MDIIAFREIKSRESDVRFSLYDDTAFRLTIFGDVTVSKGMSYEDIVEIRDGLNDLIEAADVLKRSGCSTCQ